MDQFVGLHLLYQGLYEKKIACLPKTPVTGLCPSPYLTHLRNVTQKSFNIKKGLYVRALTPSY